MPRKLIIEFSLVEESRKEAKVKIINDVADVFCNGEVNIPWVNRALEITLK